MYEIESFHLLSENEKGSTYTIEERPTSDYLFASRKADATFGNHWHEGKSKTKNPEVLFLMSGKMKMWISDTDGSNEKEVDLEAPLKLKIYPLALHRFKAETDCMFLEMNSLDDHVADTLYPTSAD